MAITISYIDSRLAREKALSYCRAKYPEIETKSLANQELTTDEVAILQTCATEWEANYTKSGWVVGGFLVLLLLVVIVWDILN